MSEENNAEQVEEAADDTVESCASCGNEFDREAMHTYEGDFYCEECFNESYFVCSCGETCHQDDGTFVNTRNGSQTVCSNCRDNNFGYCEDCEEYYYNDYIHGVEGGDRYVCESCEEHYRECAECGYLGHEDNMHYCGDCENDYCENCHCGCGDEDQEERSSSSRRRGARFDEKKPSSDKFKGIIPDKIKYGRLCGVEIESEGGNGEYLNDLLPGTVGICHDGSLSGGCEVQTPPSSYELLAKVIKDVTKTLKANEYYVRRSCGLHIHLDATDFRHKYSKIGKVAKTYYAIEDLFYDLIPNSRRSSSYCRPLRQAFSLDDFNPKSLGLLEKMWYGIGNGHISKECTEDAIRRWDGEWRRCVSRYKKEKYNSSRYWGVNLHSVFYRGTLEIRHHGGTLNATKIYHWLNFNMAIVEYALKRYKESEVKFLLGQKSSQRKLKAVSELLRLDSALANYLADRYRMFTSSATPQTVEEPENN